MPKTRKRNPRWQKVDGCSQINLRVEGEVASEINRSDFK